MRKRNLLLHDPINSLKLKLARPKRRLVNYTTCCNGLQEEWGGEELERGRITENCLPIDECLR
jgi:hypothetical protein